ncbi:GroES-like protein [Penicillium brevicompactum]|uniref:GroES-like protein n=1 Tax=Penicillium brevicompactum TaxID=5074 RepID=UPI002540D7F3|nr:GroES-like protein [Penicillium brevicompactum]KAJ5343903.1 GroES-like protein [Penicillium brevicompactum]
MNSIMRAVALVGAFNISVIDVPKPSIINATDAVIGHEAIGVIEEVGDSVELLKSGDWVVIPFAFDDGHYQYGPTVDAEAASSTGMQAEYARIPYADDSLMPVPINGSTNISIIHDYLFMSDIFATGWAALDFAGQGPGDTVAVFGAGPVGQMAILSAGVRGASKIYVVDHVQDRLELAAAHGAIPINFALEDPVEALRRFEPAGVTRVVNCVGFEAEDAQGNVNSSIVLHEAGQVVAPQGGIGVVGVYGSGDQAQTIDIKPLFMNNFSVRGGVSSPLDLGTVMLNLLASGKIHPSSIVSAVIGIEDAPEYYRRFNRREETKVVIEFPF